MKKIIVWIVVAVVVIVVGSVLYWQMVPASSSNTTQDNGAAAAATMGSPIADVTYACDNSHTIHAVFYEGPTSTAPAEAGQPPVPNGTVSVSLDGGASTVLTQTISADGARYSDGNPQVQQGQPGAETFVFWNKGNSALIMHDNAMDMTYTNCTAPAQQ